MVSYNLTIDALFLVAVMAPPPAATIAVVAFLIVLVVLVVVIVVVSVKPSVLNNIAFFYPGSSLNTSILSLPSSPTRGCRSGILALFYLSLPKRQPITGSLRWTASLSLFRSWESLIGWLVKRHEKKGSASSLSEPLRRWDCDKVFSCFYIRFTVTLSLFLLLLVNERHLKRRKWFRQCCVWVTKALRFFQDSSLF